MSNKDNPKTAGSNDVTLAVVIPTRNRSDLAIAAITSLLGQTGCRLEVFVSDNSSQDDEVQRLASFCATLADPRLTYMRPPESLAMPPHWDWALQQALARSTASHFTVHYDRKISKPNNIRYLAHVAARLPGALITYANDIVLDEPPPFTLWQVPWTGKVYEIRVARVIEMTWQARVMEMGQAFPVLSNCLIPRAIVENIRDRFGDICNSTGPDSCFIYRFCALNDSYLHLDRSLGIVYAPHRSNGLGYLRGETSGDFGDFLKMWGERSWLEAAPIPGLNLGQNMLYHEYELVRREVGGDRFPPLDMPGYLQDLAGGLKWIQDQALKDKLRIFLKEQGWQEKAPEPVVTRPAAARRPQQKRWRRVTPRRIASRIVASGRTSLQSFLRRPSVVLFLADRLGIKPQHITGYTFSSNEHALSYAQKYPRQRTPENEYLTAMEPVEVRGGS